MDEPIVIAETSDSRASGFPQMANNGKELFIAWTDIQKELPEIKIASIPVPSN